MVFSGKALVTIAAAAMFQALPAPEGFAAPKINQRAQGLSRLLGPSSINEKSGNDGDIAAIRKRAIPILEAMEDTYRTSGPTPESLIENAYGLRKDVGPYERIVTGQMLLAAWKEASAMGLFDENRKFKDRIGDGRFAGKSVVFEHIIPASVYPAGSTHLSNFRIVAPDRKREEGGELSGREKAFGGQLVKVVNEIERGKTLAKIQRGANDPKKIQYNAVGQTPEEAKKRWQKEVELAGETFNEEPSIKLSARVTATPSHMSKERWRVSGAVHNLSSHPTSVELKWWLVGITDKKRDHYIMAKGKQKMELRKGEEQEVTLYSKARGSYKKKADDHDELDKRERARSRVRMRGYILQVVHATGAVEYFASDQHLEGYVDEDDPMSIGSLTEY